MNTNKPRTLVVDFDRTVFDSDALYHDLYDLCGQRGIRRGLLDPSLALVPPDNLLFNFFLMVRRSQGIKLSLIESAITEMETFIRNRGHQYVFNDARPFLNSAAKAGWRVIILTYGDLDFQLAKFVGSKLSEFCHRFTVTSETKWRQLEILNASSVIFLDDNPKNIDEVKTRFPQVLAVEVKRQSTKYQSVRSLNADFVVNHLHWPLRLHKSG